MKKKYIYIIIGCVLAIAALFIFTGKVDKEVNLETEVKFGEFEITTSITGELQAISETEINAPAALRSRNLRISNITIQDLIPEGTLVDSGDWVATLDRSEADNTLKDILDNYEAQVSIYENAKLDSTMTLRQLRDELFNLQFAVEERKIVLEQSQFEPPAVIRQEEIAYERALRAYNQACNNYDLKVQQAEATIREAEINMERYGRSKSEMEAVLAQFDITAPAKGMVIYKKEQSGQKRTAGSTINPRDLAVATLPDLSGMISVTYANEIDVGDLRIGQLVRIGIGAFPEMNLTGNIIYMANVGEQIPNTNAKVFEIKIKVNEYESLLKPSMTTINEIVVNVIDSVLYIPIEAVHENDSLTFVYNLEGYKNIVELGEKNENHVIIKEGLDVGEKLYLSTPSEFETFKYN